MKVVTIKAMSKAYFNLLDRQAEVKDVLRLGNHLVWVTPSGTAWPSTLPPARRP